MTSFIDTKLQYNKTEFVQFGAVLSRNVRIINAKRKTRVFMNKRANYA